MKNKQNKPKRRCIDVNVEELDQIVDRARQAPLSDADYDKLKTVLHALIERLLGLKKSEKLASVFGDDHTHPSPTTPPRAEGSRGHGRNGAQAFSGARKVSIMHQQLASGDHCPGCGKGRVYAQKEPKALVRIVGQAPLAATVYELQRLRCNACGQVFTAQEPEGVGRRNTTKRPRP
jgi:transposase